MWQKTETVRHSSIIEYRNMQVNMLLNPVYTSTYIHFHVGQGIGSYVVSSQILDSPVPLARSDSPSILTLNIKYWVEQKTTTSFRALWGSKLWNVQHELWKWCSDWDKEYGNLLRRIQKDRRRHTAIQCECTRNWGPSRSYYELFGNRPIAAATVG